MKTIITALLIICALNVGAQEITGRVLDEKKEPIINCIVEVFQGGILKGGTITDYDGNYAIQTLEYGFYDVIATYTGYDTVRITRVLLQNQNTIVNVSMQQSEQNRTQSVIVKWQRPLLRPGDKEIQPMPVTYSCGGGSSTPAPYQAQHGAAINVAGNRTSGSIYIIDGVQVRSNEEMRNARPQRQFTPPGHYMFTREEINHAPTTSLRDLTTLFPGVYQARRGDDIHVYGSR